MPCILGVLGNLAFYIADMWPDGGNQGSWESFEESRLRWIYQKNGSDH